MRSTYRPTNQPSRRSVLQAGLGLAVVPSIAGALEAADAGHGHGRTLVLLHLSGGNDGLNTVIPFSDPEYYALRPRLSCVARNALAISDDMSLNPALSALVPVFERGDLAIVQGVGLIEPDYSHIGSCCLWREAMRHLFQRRASYLSDEWFPVPVPVAYRRGAIGHTLAEVARQVETPDAPEVIFATVGGFDTHTDQLSQHERVLGDLGEGMAAFLRVLERQGHAERVLMMVWSEFGRRPAENATGGTDHGSAGPVFLMGGGVRGGLYGEMPSLVCTDGGNLIPAVDCRDVCAAVAGGWIGGEIERQL